MIDMNKMDVKQLEQSIGYCFSDKLLLRQALSHSSYANEHKAEGAGDNERLEFLGDSVLEVVSSEFLYLTFPDMPEGKLTKLRASLVCEATLAFCAREFGLPEYLLLGKGEEQTGGRGRDSIVSDALEALIGAIFLDGGLDEAKSFIKRFILTDFEHKKMFTDSKTILQEIIQRDYKNSDVSYIPAGESGPDHDKHFTVALVLDGEELGRGIGSTKKSRAEVSVYVSEESGTAWL